MKVKENILPNDIYQDLLSMFKDRICGAHLVRILLLPLTSLLP